MLDIEGVNCEVVIKDFCVDNFCVNGGICLRIGDKCWNYICICFLNFIGRNCIVNIILLFVVVILILFFEISKVFFIVLVVNFSFVI